MLRVEAELVRADARDDVAHFGHGLDQMALDAQVEAEGAVDLGTAPLMFQIVLGMLMPFVLALVAIPLEAFLKNARVVALFLLGAALMLLALPLQVLGVALRWLGGVLWAAYETLAFLPASLMRLVRGRTAQRSAEGTVQGTVQGTVPGGAGE